MMTGAFVTDRHAARDAIIEALHEGDPFEPDDELAERIMDALTPDALEGTWVFDDDWARAIWWLIDTSGRPIGAISRRGGWWYAEAFTAGPRDLGAHSLCPAAKAAVQFYTRCAIAM